MIVINMFAGPGAGKSSCAADLFAYMKWMGCNVELIDEYAKQLSWEKNFTILEDQLYVMASQNRKLWRLRNQVDYVITDSPTILAPLYAPEGYLSNYFEKLTHESFQSYDNINFLLEREKPFNPVGRHHTEEQSKQKDEEIRNMLNIYGYDYYTIPANPNAKYEIYSRIASKVAMDVFEVEIDNDKIKKVLKDDPRFS